MSGKKLQSMKKGGNILAKTMGEAIGYTKPGRSLLDIEKFFCKKLASFGVEASFKKVPGYSWATCINLNNGVVHGIPDDTEISDGDLVSIDGGAYFDGFHTDMAYTFIAGKPLSYVFKDSFLSSGRKALDEAIKVAKIGNRVGDISQAIQNQIEGDGFNCVETLTGHGVGENLHQNPYIPCLLRGDIGKTSPLLEDQGLAIEIIYTDSRPRLGTESNGWTIVNKGGKISGLFEKSVYVIGCGVVDLTPYFWE